MPGKCTKLIFAYSKSAKLNSGLKYATLKTIYTGGILSLLLYGAPKWKKTIDNVSSKSKLLRLLRSINIRMAKAYPTVSNEALCMLTGLTPIDLKIENAFQFYHLTKGSTKEEALVDYDMEVKYWHHQAETINFLTENIEKTSSIQILTDGSKTKEWVDAGVAILKSGNHFKSLKYNLSKRFTNNQAEQLTILRAIKYTESLQTKDKTAAIYTASRMKLGSPKNSEIHSSLTEEIRTKLTEMVKKLENSSFLG
jgi:hypothetical protein